MSDGAAQDLITNSIKDEAFRNKLVSDFNNAIADYNLTNEEIEALRKIDWSKPLPSGATVMGTWVHIYKTSASPF